MAKAKPSDGEYNARVNLTPKFKRLLAGLVKKCGGTNRLAAMAKEVTESTLHLVELFPLYALPQRTLWRVNQAGTRRAHWRVVNALCYVGPRLQVGTEWEWTLSVMSPQAQEAYDKWMKYVGDRMAWLVNEFAAWGQPLPAQSLALIRAFVKKQLAAGHERWRVDYATARVLRPLVEGLYGPGAGIELSPDELRRTRGRSTDLERFVKLSLESEDILLNRSPARIRVQERFGLLPDVEAARLGGSAVAKPRRKRGPKHTQSNRRMRKHDAIATWSGRAEGL